MNLYNANIIAECLYSDIAPYCEPGFLHIAGSIRRKKDADIKDVEIVCIPQKSIHKETNLFGEVIKETTVIHPGFIEAIQKAGTIVKGKFTGRYMKIEMTREIEGTVQLINLDLFMPQKHDYFRQLAIRIGSAEYSKRFIANKWVALGWCGVCGDLRLQRECNQQADKSWQLKPHIANPTLPPVWHSEQEFFKWLGVQYLEPEQRNL